MAVWYNLKMNSTEYERNTKIIHSANNVNDALAFVYVPKTGGTYLSINTLPIKFYKNIKNTNWPSDFHIPVSKIESITNGDYPLFTILRDPYDRTCSEYYFTKERVEVGLQYFGEWDLKDPRKLQFVAKRIGIITDSKHYENKIINIYQNNMTVEDYLEWSINDPTYPIYYDTKTPEDFDIVGITEYIPQTIQLLKNMYGIEAGNGDFNNNKTKIVGKPYETKFSRLEYERKNVIEYQYYKEAINKFNQLCQIFI